jgi:hypothetical protein
LDDDTFQGISWRPTLFGIEHRSTNVFIEDVGMIDAALDGDVWRN